MMIRIAGPRWGMAELKALWAFRDGVEALRASFVKGPGVESLDFLPLASGRVAIALALKTLGLEGGRIAVPAMCCDTVILPVVACGAEPVYVDSEPDELCMSVERLEAAMDATPVDAVIAAHFLGQKLHMQRIVELCRHRGVLLIDDAAYLAGVSEQGRLAGTEGDCGIWSFHAKLLYGFSGGMLLGSPEFIDECRGRLVATERPTTPRAPLLRECVINLLRRLLRSHVPRWLAGRGVPCSWRRDKNLAMPPESQWRASPQQCALMASQLRRVSEIVCRSTRNVGMYREILRDHSVFQVAGLPYGGCFARFVPIAWKSEASNAADQADRADRTYRLQRELFSRGVQSQMYVPPWVNPSKETGGDLPNCRDMWPRVICVPSHSLMTPRDISYVCCALEQAWEASDSATSTLSRVC